MKIWWIFKVGIQKNEIWGTEVVFSIRFWLALLQKNSCFHIKCFFFTLLCPKSHLSSKVPLGMGSEGLLWVWDQQYYFLCVNSHFLIIFLKLSFILTCFFGVILHNLFFFQRRFNMEKSIKKQYVAWKIQKTCNSRPIFLTDCGQCFLDRNFTYISEGINIHSFFWAFPTSFLGFNNIIT